MDEEPTLDFQKVGEAFVIQYYTQMHKDPAQMYRFYQDTSSFVHGGSEIGRGEITRGRKAIHEKIMSLNLHQVHTKIRQVDSHASVPNNIGPSIVIQVTGELSIAWETMRPFVQTFVLALESERKYFLYNDIFRHQVYDEDLENEPNQQQENTVSTDQQVIDRPLSKQAKSPSLPDESQYNSTEQTLPSGAVELGTDQRSPVPLGSAGHSDVIHETTTTTSGSWNDQYGGGEIQSNGLPEEAHVTLGEEPTYPLDTDEEETTIPVDSHIDEDDGKDDLTMSNDGKSQPAPGTWAARLAQNMTKSSQPQQQYFQQSTKQSQSTNKMSNVAPLPQREPKPVKKPEQRPIEKKPFASSTNPITSRSAPDSHQVFVGGLPTGTTDTDLKEVFKHFGKIIEVRVNPKNFGFVVFDNEQSVREVMSSKDDSPLMIRDKRLNIEEKRQSSKGGIGFGQSLGRKVPSRSINRPQRRS